LSPKKGLNAGMSSLIGGSIELKGPINKSILGRCKNGKTRQTFQTSATPFCLNFKRKQIKE